MIGKINRRNMSVVGLLQLVSCEHARISANSNGARMCEYSQSLLKIENNTQLHDVSMMSKAKTNT